MSGILRSTNQLHRHVQLICGLLWTWFELRLCSRATSFYNVLHVIKARFVHWKSCIKMTAVFVCVFLTVHLALQAYFVCKKGFVGWKVELVQQTVLAGDSGWLGKSDQDGSRRGGRRTCQLIMAWLCSQHTCKDVRFPPTLQFLQLKAKLGKLDFLLGVPVQTAQQETSTTLPRPSLKQVARAMVLSANLWNSTSASAQFTLGPALMWERFNLFRILLRVHLQRPWYIFPECVAEGSCL